MNLDKEVYTTFEVARVCNANITSIKNWIDKGELRAFRTPGGHYRIEQKVLDDFLTRHGMPNPFAEERQKRILVIQEDKELLGQVKQHFGEDPDYDWTDDVVDAVLKIGQWKPDAVVVDSQMESLDAPGLCQRVREHQELRPVHLIVIHDQEQDYEELVREAGADYVVRRDEGASQVIDAIRRALI